MFEVNRELSKLPPGALGVCEVAGRFVAEWFGPIAEGDGCGAQEIEGAERGLGFSLPPALRWVYSKVGRRDDLLRRQDPLLEIESLRVRDGALMFREENQKCALWGVRVSDAGRDDPPVVWKDLNARGDAPWQPYQDRLSAALLELILSESMFSHGRNVRYREAEDSILSRLPSDFEPFPELDHVFRPIPDGPAVRWFGSADALLRSDGEAWLWLYARTPEALAEASQAIPGNWEQLDA